MKKPQFILEESFSSPHFAPRSKALSQRLPHILSEIQRRESRKEESHDRQ